MKFWTCDKCGIGMKRKEKISTGLQTATGFSRIDLCFCCASKYLSFGYASIMPRPIIFGRKNFERERERKMSRHIQ